MTEKQVNQRRIKICSDLAGIAEEKNITHQEIADRSGLIRSNVSRVLSARYSPTLDVLIKIAAAVDADIKIE